MYYKITARTLLNPAYEKLSFATIAILFLALSPIVWPNSFMPGFFIMMSRYNTSQESRNYEENWRRNAPFSNSYDYQILETKHYNMVKLFAIPTDTLRIFWQQKQQPESQL